MTILAARSCLPSLQRRAAAWLQQGSLGALGTSAGWSSQLWEAAPASGKAAATGRRHPVRHFATQYTEEEVAKHNSDKSAWIIVDNKVYDTTPFLNDHPGGSISILFMAGFDATDDFNGIHSPEAREQLLTYYIGDLAPAAAADLQHEEAVAAEEEHGLSEDLVALDSRLRRSFPLLKKESLSPTVRLFCFGLPSDNHRLGLPVGQHVMLYTKSGDELVARPYTPISSDNERGHFELAVRVYRHSVHPKYPDGGKMSQLLDSMVPGKDSIEAKGPMGHVCYQGRGEWRVGEHYVQTKAVSMVAGGTGITPMWQCITAILSDEDDPTQICLLYGNVSPGEMLLRKELDELAAQHPKRFKLHYTVDHPTPDWPHSTGYITPEMAREHLCPGGPTSLGLLCGPLPMVQSCQEALKGMGYADDHCVRL